MSEVTFDSKITVTLDDQWGDEQKICRMARVSTGYIGSYKQDVGLIRRLLLDRHTVPFEHCGYTFYIDSPMTTTRQILKHRMSSISETSGRYRELEPRFYIADKSRLVKQVGKAMDYKFEKDSKAYKIHAFATRFTNMISWEMYKWQLKRGVAREKARDVISPNYYSPLYITMNLGSVLHFLSLREDWGDEARVPTHPQWEISEVARQIAEHVKADYPTVWTAFVENGYTR